MQDSSLAAWIGRARVLQDELSWSAVRRLVATLDLAAEAIPATGAAVPPHWLAVLFDEAAPQSQLGADGHPRKGDFLPPVALPRRMLAGRRITYAAPAHVGETFTRRSEITAITNKTGRSGQLVFVTVRHVVQGRHGVVATEEQDIAYREAASAGTQVPQAPGPGMPAPAWQVAFAPDPVLLFRYSALTFNGHRIHYDRRYVTEIEGYPGLIVHGPLQATLLVDFAASIKGAAPAQFRFRGVQPLFDFERFRLCAREKDAGLHLWIEAEDGRQTMDAQALW